MEDERNPFWNIFIDEPSTDPEQPQRGAASDPVYGRTNDLLTRVDRMLAYRELEELAAVLSPDVECDDFACSPEYDPGAVQEQLPAPGLLLF